MKNEWCEGSFNKTPKVKESHFQVTRFLGFVMGARDSKLLGQVLTYEEAVKRGKSLLKPITLDTEFICIFNKLTHDPYNLTVSSTEFKRLKDAFSKHSTSSGHLQQAVFFSDVLGETVPNSLAELIYSAWGGTSKGISFKELLCGLVLLTNGQQEEKCKCK